jgi:hypothetical protein
VTELKKQWLLAKNKQLYTTSTTFNFPATKYRTRGGRKREGGGGEVREGEEGREVGRERERENVRSSDYITHILSHFC